MQLLCAGSLNQPENLCVLLAVCYFQFSVACSILLAVCCCTGKLGGLETREVNMIAKFSTALHWEVQLYLLIGCNRKQKTKLKKKWYEPEVRVRQQRHWGSFFLQGMLQYLDTLCHIRRNYYTIVGHGFLE